MSIVIACIRGLKTPVIATHEPPSSSAAIPGRNPKRLNPKPRPRVLFFGGLGFTRTLNPGLSPAKAFHDLGLGLGFSVRG